MSKAYALVIGLLFVLLLATTVSAKTSNPNANENGQIPEISGDYAVPGKPDLRVRVFVHGEKGKKPKPTPPPAACSDPQSDAVVRSAGWKLPSTNILYKVNQESALEPIKDSVSGFVADSFTEWTNSINSNSKPTLKQDGLTTKTSYGLDEENIIAWGTTSSSTLGVTYIWYNRRTREVVEVDTIMNSKMPWDLDCNDNNYNAKNIMIHELGHWFGLNDHYTGAYADNTMYGYGSKEEIKKITPTQGDINGINRIYP